MPDTAISNLTAAGTVHSDDLLVDVDVHDLTMASSGTDKKLTVSQLFGAITGDVAVSGLASKVTTTAGTNIRGLIYAFAARNIIM